MDEAHLHHAQVSEEVDRHRGRIDRRRATPGLGDALVPMSFHSSRTVLGDKDEVAAQTGHDHLIFRLRLRRMPTDAQVELWRRGATRTPPCVGVERTGSRVGATLVWACCD